MLAHTAKSITSNYQLRVCFPTPGPRRVLSHSALMMCVAVKPNTKFSPGAVVKTGNVEVMLWSRKSC